MAADRQLFIEIVVDEKGSVSKLRQVDTAVRGVGAGASQTTPQLSKFQKEVLTASAAGAFLAETLYDVGKGALVSLRREITASVSTASSFRNTFIGLSTVAKAFKQDVNATESAAQDLAKDGLLTVQESAAGLKNLLSSGFGLNEAISLMKGFKDTAAFNRQASLEYGYAIVSATEGIKNQNSILVDNAGLTKNLSVVMKEAGLSINDMAKISSDAAVRQKFLGGLMKEMSFASGDAAKMSDTYSGSMSRLNTNIALARKEVGERFMPVFRTAADVLTGVLKVVQYAPGLFLTAAAALAAMVAAGVGMAGWVLYGDTILKIGAAIRVMSASALASVPSLNAMWAAAMGPAGLVAAGVGAVALGISWGIERSAQNKLDAVTKDYVDDRIKEASEAAGREVRTIQEANGILERIANERKRLLEDRQKGGPATAAWLRATQAEAVANVTLREKDSVYSAEIGQLNARTLNTIAKSMRDGAMDAKAWSDKLKEIGVVVSEDTLSTFADRMDKAEKATEKANAPMKELREDLKKLNDEIALAQARGVPFSEIVERYGSRLEESAHQAKLHNTALGQSARFMQATMEAEAALERRRAGSKLDTDMPAVPDFAAIGAATPMADDVENFAYYKRLFDAREEHTRNTLARQHEARQQDLEDHIAYLEQIGAAEGEINNVKRLLAEDRLAEDRELLRQDFEQTTAGLDRESELYKTYYAEYLAQDEYLTQRHEEEERKRRKATETTLDFVIRMVSQLSGALRALGQTAGGSFGQALVRIADFADATTDGVKAADNLQKAYKAFNKEGATTREKWAAGVQMATEGVAVVEGYIRAMRAGGDSKGGRAMADGAYGASVGSQFGPYGALAGAGVGLVGGLMSDPQAEGRAEYRDWQRGLIQRFDDVATAAQRAEIASHALVEEFGNLGGFGPKVFVTVRDAYLATGHTAQDALADLRAVREAAAEGPEAVAEAVERINRELERADQLFDARKQKRTMLREAVERYGIKFEDAGKGFQQADLAERAERIAEDYKLLTESGMAARDVTAAMGESINKFIADAKKSGTEVPNSMRPMLQQMIDNKQLLDENGKAYATLEEAGIRFGETLTTMFENVLQKLEELITKLSQPLPEHDAYTGGVAQRNPELPPLDPAELERRRQEQAKRDEMDQRAGNDPRGDGRIPRYHTGGVVDFAAWKRAHSGLAIDEVPIVAQKGEGILSRDAMARLGRAGFNTLNHGGVQTSALPQFRTERGTDRRGGSLSISVGDVHVGGVNSEADLVDRIGRKVLGKLKARGVRFDKAA